VKDTLSTIYKSVPPALTADKAPLRRMGLQENFEPNRQGGWLWYYL